MTEKRFDVVMNEFDEVEYITDIVDCEDRDFADFMEFANEMAEENKQLKKENKKLQDEYDLWIYSSSNCEYDSLKGENEQLKKENKQLLCTIVEILDFIEDKREVSLEEMRRWWKEKEKELME